MLLIARGLPPKAQVASVLITAMTVET